MEALYYRVLQNRKGNAALNKRLELYSELIYSALQNLTKDNESMVSEVVNVLIRKSSELNNYSKTTDLIYSKLNKKDQRVSHEHVVPCATIRDHFLNNKSINTAEIKHILLTCGMRALIAKKDNDHINKIYKSTMPSNWTFPDKEKINETSNPFLRYKSIIKKVKVR